MLDIDVSQTGQSQAEQSHRSTKEANKANTRPYCIPFIFILFHWPRPHLCAGQSAPCRVWRLCCCELADMLEAGILLISTSKGDGGKDFTGKRSRCADPRTCCAQVSTFVGAMASRLGSETVQKHHHPKQLDTHSWLLLTSPYQFCPLGQHSSMALGIFRLKTDLRQAVDCASVADHGHLI